MATWPEELPGPAIGTYNETRPDNTLRSSMDKGPAILRRRTTANVTPVSFGLILTGEQVQILSDFYDEDTFSGSEQFVFENPRTLLTEQARFTAPPSFSHIEGDNWSAAVAVEYLP